MDKHLFVFVGRPKSGKTEAAKEVRKILSKKLQHKGYTEENLNTRLTIDILVAFNLKGKTDIAIASHGDDCKIIYRNLENTKHSKIIICTSRQTKRHLSTVANFAMENKYNIYPIYKIHYDKKDTAHHRADKERAIGDFLLRAESIGLLK